MKLIDLNDDSVYTITDLKKGWQVLRAQEPENHAPDFMTEVFEILMATINGRNDLDIIGLTPRETSHLIFRLRTQFLN